MGAAAKERTSMETIRDVLRLFHEEGLSCNQAAAILSVSAGTVSRVLRRAEAAGLGWPLAADVDPPAGFQFVHPAWERVGGACATVPGSDCVGPGDVARRTRFAEGAQAALEGYRDGVPAGGGTGFRGIQRQFPGFEPVKKSKSQPSSACRTVSA